MFRNQQTAIRVWFRSGVLVLLLLPAACQQAAAPATSADGKTAVQVLGLAVKNMLAWKSYRYSGISRLTVGTNTALSNQNSFDTVLVQNDQGGLDGHMVVPGSYESYTWRGNTYTRPAGKGWEKKPGKGDGHGMVSRQARQVIARFAELCEQVKFEKVTADAYVVSLVMGPRYYAGAEKIFYPRGRTAHQGHPANFSKLKTAMTSIDGKPLHGQGADGDAKQNARGRVDHHDHLREVYGFQKTFVITPPPEALQARDPDPHR
jgi:hypothetical protein